MAGLDTLEGIQIIFFQPDIRNKMFFILEMWLREYNLFSEKLWKEARIFSKTFEFSDRNPARFENW